MCKVGLALSSSNFSKRELLATVSASLNSIAVLAHVAQYPQGEVINMTGTLRIGWNAAIRKLPIRYADAAKIRLAVVGIGVWRRRLLRCRRANV